MHIDPRYLGHVSLQCRKIRDRSFYLIPPRGETPDLQWLATAEVLLITEKFPNGIRYRPTKLRITDSGHAAADLVPADRWQENMEKRWLPLNRDELITKVILRSPDGEATLERKDGFYRVAA